MVLTSASANKMIRLLEDQKQYLLDNEANDSKYVLADDEVKDIPDYDFDKYDSDIDELDYKIRIIKHITRDSNIKFSINMFNTNTLLSIGITIDQALVEMAQLSNKIQRLRAMRRAKNKERLLGVNAGRYNIAEYQYLNYNKQDVNETYRQAMIRIHKIQLALDLVNQTKEFTVDLDL